MPMMYAATNTNLLWPQEMDWQICQHILPHTWLQVSECAIDYHYIAPIYCPRVTSGQSMCKTHGHYGHTANWSNQMGQQAIKYSIKQACTPEGGLGGHFPSLRPVVWS